VFDQLSSVIKEHIAKSRSANTHSAKLLVLTSLLKNLFGVELDEIIPGIETKLGSKLWGIRGSADLIFSNVIFEIKVDMKKELNDAKRQLMKYFQVLHEIEPEKKHIGIATDVIKFLAFSSIIEKDKVVDLKEIGSINIAESSPSECVLWLDSFIFSKPKIEPSAQDLRWRFGPDSPTYSVSVDELNKLWSKVKDEKDVSLKLDLWARNMEIVYGSRPEIASFIDHTYLVTLVKLIVYLKLSGSDEVDEEDLKRALTGEYFSNYGIANLIEEDFFAWVMHPKIVNEAISLFVRIAKELLRYNLSEIEEDFFKEIYQDIVKRSERHRIGEYYTPEWLVQLTLEEAINLWKERNQGFPRILDPACGSGTFLCNSIHIVKKELQRAGKSPDQILEFIINNIVGVDVNPLTAIIARANYLIALGDLIQLGKPIMIPVYIADSIRIPDVKSRMATVGGKIAVYEVKVDGSRVPIQIPRSVIIQKSILSQVLEALRSATNVYKTRSDRNEAISIFKREVSGILSSDEFDVLKATLNTILSLIDKGQDSIWIFILNNIYAPIALMETKFNIIIGNPPWIAMRYVENKNYQDFLKQQVLAYKLLESDQVHLFTHMEAATLFFCRSSDLYLNDDGVIAFVMPRSVLTSAFHHTNFKQLKSPRMSLSKIIDLEDVSPLFNVPSSVLIAVKGGETKYPVPSKRYAGRLPEKNIKLAEAKAYLTVNDYMYEPLAIPSKYSYSFYHDKVKQGATIVPRNIWFIDFIIHPTLGINSSKPAVKTSEESIKAAKDPWRNVALEGNVESDFIYTTLLGGDLVSFGFVKLRPIVIPAKPLTTQYKLLDIEELRSAGYAGMATWLSNAQKYWEKNATKRAIKDHPRIILWLNYRNKLTLQNPSKRYVVLYNTSGTNLVSCVVDKQSLSPFQILKAEISPKGFIAESKTYFYETDDEAEAHYICAVLNSDVVNDAIKPLQPRGLYGERDIHRRPFMLPIPKFNKKDQLHIKLANLSKRCHSKVSSVKFTKKSVASLRREVRKTVEKEIAEIDKLVSQLLGS